MEANITDAFMCSVRSLSALSPKGAQSFIHACLLPVDNRKLG
ncbi:hypothetical protein [Stygiolobus caldivivus]|nr:hypothetical protein [Stygiolobus caldivivus]